MSYSLRTLPQKYVAIAHQGHAEDHATSVVDGLLDKTSPQLIQDVFDRIEIGARRLPFKDLNKFVLARAFPVFHLAGLHGHGMHVTVQFHEIHGNTTLLFTMNTV